MSVYGTLSANKFSIQGRGAIGSNITMSVADDKFLMKFGNETLLSVTSEDSGVMNDSTVTDSKITFTKAVDFTDPVTFTDTVTGLTKSTVGLANVDNTSDANKPVSTATAAAIAALTKSSVGLANVDNTSDLNKPVSTATSAAIAVVTNGTSNLVSQFSGFISSTYQSYLKESIISSLEVGTVPLARPIGSTTEIYSEFTDACNVTNSAFYTYDGLGGPRDFAYCTQKALLTIGESHAPTNYYPTGPPDGMAAYLLDSSTVRVVYNDESLSMCSNVTSTTNGTLIGGTRVNFVDYDRTKLADFMNNTKSAQDMVLNAGNLRNGAKFYNVLGSEIGPRNRATYDAASANPHYPNCDVDGRLAYTSASVNNVFGPADWIVGVGCSADLMTKHQWGVSNGVENSMYMWVDEYPFTSQLISLVGKTVGYEDVRGSNHTGYGAYTTDLETRSTYTIGAFGTGGWEKVTEMNPGNSNYVCFIPNGYNIWESSGAVALNRETGSNYVRTVFERPQEVYIGIKNYKLDGSGNPVALTAQEIADKADSTYLARNGLEYGQLYGFALSNDANWPSYSNLEAYWSSSSLTNGQTVSGQYMAIPWRWKKILEPAYRTDVSKWQKSPLTSANDYTTLTPNYKFWNSTGDATGVYKVEHAASDPYGGQRYVVGTNTRVSGTAPNLSVEPGYITMHDLTGLSTLLNGLSGTQFPTSIPATVKLVVSFNTANKNNYQVLTAGGAKNRVGNFGGRAVITEEQNKVPVLVDTLQWYSASNNQNWLYMGEDASSSSSSSGSGSTNPVIAFAGDAHNAAWLAPFTPNDLAGKKVPLYFMSQLSGGTASSKFKQSIPANTNYENVTNAFYQADRTHEYSGSWDLSGMLHKSSGAFVANTTTKLRTIDSQVPINNKTIMIGADMHYVAGGVIGKNTLGQGGQILALKPKNL